MRPQFLIGAAIGKFYRPEKKPVTMRLDSDVIAWLKSDGRGYQTKANRLLRNAMLHFTTGVDQTSHGTARKAVGARRAKRDSRNGNSKRAELASATKQAKICLLNYVHRN